MKIALPIETKVREFRGKLWLALNLVAEGHKVTIGNISSINKGLDMIEPDIYFGDSAYYRSSRENLYHKIQTSGGSVVVLDTEGGVFRSDEQYEERLSPQILEFVDHFCAWGSRPAEIAAQSEQLPEKNIHVTGNPRFDLLHSDLRGIYSPEAENHQNKYGEYILINTNFTIANPFDQEIIETTDEKKISYQTELWQEFIDTIQFLAKKIEKYTFIIRPHPSEDHNRYRTKVQSYSNIKVRHEGDVRSWIYNASATVHNSCTTGIESALIGTPVFSYRPIKDSDYDLELPNIVSEETSKDVELYNALKQIQADEEYQMDKNQKNKLQEFFYNVEDRSVSRIVSVIENSLDKSSSTTNFVENVPLRQQVKRIGVSLFGIRTTEKILQRLTHRDYSYMRQKFPGLSSDEVRNEIQQLQSHAQVPNASIKHRPELGGVFTLAGSP